MHVSVIAHVNSSIAINWTIHMEGGFTSLGPNCANISSRVNNIECCFLTLPLEPIEKGILSHTRYKNLQVRIIFLNSYLSSVLQFLIVQPFCFNSSLPVLAFYFKAQ